VGILARLIARREPAVPLAMNLKAGLGAFLAILLLGVLFDRTSLPFLLAPFGASAILLFGRPEGVLAQPINFVAGYAIAALVAFASAELFPGVLWATAISIGVSLVLMRVLRVTHPPAGAIPLLAFAEPGRDLQLVQAVLVGSTALVLIALVYHRIPPKQPYPMRAGRGPVADE
jgi:CBS-domain-containing membrane protein